MNQQAFIDDFRAKNPDSSLSDEALDALGRALGEAQSFFTEHKIPTAVLFDAGNSYLGAIYMGGKDRYPPEFPIAKMLIDDDTPPSMMVLGFDALKGEYTKALEAREPWSVEGKVIDQGFEEITDLHEVADLYGIPMIACAHFGRVGSGADSSPNKIISTGGNARAGFTALEVFRAAFSGDMERLESALQAEPYGDVTSFLAGFKAAENRNKH